MAEHYVTILVYLPSLKQSKVDEMLPSPWKRQKIDRLMGTVDSLASITLALQKTYCRSPRFGILWCCRLPMSWALGTVLVPILTSYKLQSSNVPLKSTKRHAWESRKTCSYMLGFRIGDASEIWVVWLVNSGNRRERDERETGLSELLNRHLLSCVRF